MLMAWEVAELVRQRTGIRLRTFPQIGGSPEYLLLCAAPSVLEEDPRVLQALYGPYQDRENPGVQILVNYCLMDDNPTLQLVVVDADDGVILNSTAVGAEKYNLGVIR